MGANLDRDTGSNGTSVASLGADGLAAALVYNVLLSHTFGLLGLFILCAFGDFANNLPASKGSVTMFYLTAVLASFSLLGGTVYSEKESLGHMKFFLYISPTYWYIKGTFTRWLIGRTYNSTPAVMCGTVSGLKTAAMPRDICGDELFETLYGSKDVNHGTPLLVLFCMICGLSLLSFAVFGCQMRHTHSAKAAEVERRASLSRDSVDDF